MSKIIIPKEQLPNLSENFTNKLRYRVVNKNRNLYSDWSIIGEIKRNLEETNFNDNADSFTAYSANSKIEVSWYITDINQEYQIYVKYISHTNPTHTWETTQYLGKKATNSVSIAQKPIASDPYGAQILVKLPAYPDIANQIMNVDFISRGSGVATYQTDRSHLLSSGDYVDLMVSNEGSTDRSPMAGFKKVLSIINANTFTVTDGGSTVSSYTPTSSTVQKINGNVQFTTAVILF
jgi:hypothetical protein